jgi:endonuclease/exonuclease/phosphatase (EEP) superfamily protein YafD
MADFRDAARDVASRAAMMQAPARLLFRGLGLLAVGLPVVSALALAAPRWWWADLLVHFRLQYCVLGVALALAAVFWRRASWLLAAALAVALNVAPVRAQLQSVPAPLAFAAPRDAAQFRIAAANLYFGNTRHAAALRWARESGADVLVFVEVDARWRPALRALTDRYPYVHPQQAHGRTDILVLSRWPIAAPAVESTPTSRMAVVDVQGPGATWRLLAVHANWPLGPAASRARAHDLKAVAATARVASVPVVAIGDFNVSPLSPHFAALLADGRLRDAAAGRGWQPTWPTFLPPLGIRIDHALVSDGVRVNSFRRGRLEGSDHRPIVVDLALPARRA